MKKSFNYMFGDKNIINKIHRQDEKKNRKCGTEKSSIIEII